MNEIIKLKQMAIDVYNKKPASSFSVIETEEALRKELNDMIKTDGKVDFYKFQANKWMVFQIISESVDAVLPQKVLSVLDKYCETKQVAQGDKIRFKLKKGVSGVKNFITKVGA
jgi:hypothetical protein